MKENVFLGFKEWFHNYVRSFYTDDNFIQQNIILKEEHSIRVYENASLIAEAEELSTEDIYLAKTVALFHDIGRFEQIRKYRTFRDSDSENHAFLGVKVLKKEGVLACLPAYEQEIILTAIEYHNVHILPEFPDRKIQLHSRIIRDADKLDIYRVITDYFNVKAEFPNPALDLEMPDTPEFSGKIIGDLLNNRVASMKDIRNCNDMNLARLAWIFDISFVETMRLIQGNGYIAKIIAAMPQNSEIDKIHDHLENYMSTFIGDNS